MIRTYKDPPRVSAAGYGICSLLGGENNPEIAPTQGHPQAENAASTAPGLLDLNYLNVELDLRICAVKAIQAATDLEIGEPDELAETNICVAVNHLKDAAARFRQIKDAKSARAEAITAEACQ